MVIRNSVDDRYQPPSSAFVSSRTFISPRKKWWESAPAAV